MALLWADNFQTYGTDETKLLDGVYAQISNGVSRQVDLVTDPDPNASADSKAIRWQRSDNSSSFRTTLRFVFPGGSLATAGFACRLWPEELPSQAIEAWYASFRDSSNTILLTLELMTTGQLRIYRGSKDAGTLLATSTVPVITAGAWNHIEMKATFNDTTGATEVRVNGVEVAGLTLSSTDTTPNSNTAAQVGFSSGESSLGEYTTYYLKDLIVWDTNGTQNNDFLGSCHVYTLQLDGDTSFNWDASTGSTGYNLIDELTPNDADYISADATPPAASEFTFENLPADIVSVKGLLTVARMRKTDGGDGQVQMGVKSNGSTDSGADRTITTAFTYWWDVSELSADTASAYTPTEVNAATVTIDRTV